MPHTQDVEKSDLALVEAALFLSPRPLSERQIAKLLGEGISKAYVERLLDELAETLASPLRGIELRRDQGRAFLRVKSPYIDTVAHLAPHQDIPAPVLRSLAMIAYNHPMTQADLVKARGNKAYQHVQSLLARRLIRAEDHGRTMLLHVTEEFLRHFGLKTIEEFRFHVGEVDEAGESAPEVQPEHAPDPNTLREESDAGVPTETDAGDKTEA
jgi:segregation and condensation protein B